MKKKSFLLIISIILLLTTACSKEEDKENSNESKSKISFKAGHSSPEGISIDKSIKEAAEDLKENSDGRLSLEIYPAGQLGGDREQIEAIQFGDQDIWKGASSALVPFIGDFAVFDMPMIFGDYTHEEIQKVLSGEVGSFREIMNKKAEEKGLVLISLSSNETYRTMSTNVPIKTIDDFSQVRIRTMENKYHIKFWEDVGAKPTPVNFSELYVALQQGVVNSQENPVVGLVGSGQYEQQKYITDTNHLLTISCMVMNKGKYDALSDEDKKLINEFSNENVDLEYKYGKEEYGAMKKKAEDYGIEFIVLDDNIKKQLKDRAKGTIDLVSSDVNKEVVDSLFSSLKEVN